MVESRERLKSLRDGFAGLQFGDENGLHRLSTRAEMLIKRIFPAILSQPLTVPPSASSGDF
jgi:hypothetical protein